MSTSIACHSNPSELRRCRRTRRARWQRCVQAPNSASSPIPHPKSAFPGQLLAVAPARQLGCAQPGEPIGSRVDPHFGKERCATAAVVEREALRHAIATSPSDERTRSLARRDAVWIRDRDDSRRGAGNSPHGRLKGSGTGGFGPLPGEVLVLKVTHNHLPQIIDLQELRGDSASYRV